MDDDARRAVERLLAIEEIKQLKARYFRLLDLHRWDEWREVFSEDLVLNIPESEHQPQSRDELVAAAREHLGDAVTVHHGHMPEIEIVDDSNARGTWAMFDLVEPVAGSRFPVMTGFGHYDEEYRKIDGQWRIARLSLSRLKRVVRPAD